MNLEEFVKRGQMAAVDRQLGLFSERQSEAARIQGMAVATERRKAMVDHARKVARQMAARVHGRHEPDGTPVGITADDVVQELVRQGFDMHCLGNAAGALFRGGDFRWTGRWVKSTRAHAHGNLLRVWRLKE